MTDVKRFCIIGAGACGLAVVKTFAERGIPFDCFEAEGDLGGIWNPGSPHAVYGSTHLNSSKKLSRYPDFKFPDEMPYYVSAAQAHEYLRAYAAEYGIYDRITFNTRVSAIERADKGWRVTLEGESEPRIYDGVVVANGHHWHPYTPDYPGTFAGEMLHSHDVKSKGQLKDKRVLVVGAGNSAAIFATRPKTARPSTRCAAPITSSPRCCSASRPTRSSTVSVICRLPRHFMYSLYKLGMWVLIGSHERYGLPKPDHDLFEAHPTACTTYLDHIVHGRIVPKPGITRFEGKRVFFRDEEETSEEVDLLVWATGYRVHFPFMDDSYVLDENGWPKLFIHTFHREWDDFFVCGLFEPAEGGVWQIADYQARLIAAFITAQEEDPKRAAWFRELKRHANPDIGHGLKHQDTPWHRFEIQHLRFRRYMKRLLKKFGPCAPPEQEMRTMGETAEEREAEKLKLAS
ncbi:hypothetical protein AUC71_08340 [Methyloceanibacter marginalis]|uniref:Trimethylamine monooxygenase n=1 Tax=Methyloceanibacter marginalis TaxID=1774971 RepID=A0A1E3WD72_9HYPH|nr:NAD(P)-binding domain-containing protein [Methyloceanibacter marginalis]ODS03680.1 hypothetical protein AUC71_08340 [Methyloceanibacter marginalis]